MQLYDIKSQINAETCNEPNKNFQLPLIIYKMLYNSYLSKNIKETKKTVFHRGMWKYV